MLLGIYDCTFSFSAGKIVHLAQDWKMLRLESIVWKGLSLHPGRLITCSTAKKAHTGEPVGQSLFGDSKGLDRPSSTSILWGPISRRRECNTRYEALLGGTLIHYNSTRAVVGERSEGGVIFTIKWWGQGRP